MISHTHSFRIGYSFGKDGDRIDPLVCFKVPPHASVRRVIKCYSTFVSRARTWWLNSCTEITRSRNKFKKVQRTNELQRIVTIKRNNKTELLLHSLHWTTFIQNIYTCMRCIAIKG